MAGCEAASAAAASVSARSSRANRNTEITVMLNRSPGKANSGSKETVRLQSWHRYRRTRITPSKSGSTNPAAFQTAAGPVRILAPVLCGLNVRKAPCYGGEDRGPLHSAPVPVVLSRAVFADMPYLYGM